MEKESIQGNGAAPAGDVLSEPAGDVLSERPELLLGLAFAGGFLLARLVRRLGG